MTRRESDFVPELSRPSLHVIRCCGPASALDEMAVPEHCLAGRVAADELLLLVHESWFEQTFRQVAAELETVAAIVADHSDAFTITSLTGNVHHAAARLTAINMREERFVQGIVAEVACKVFVTPEHLYLLAPSTHARHVERRLLEAATTP